MRLAAPSQHEKEAGHPRRDWAEYDASASLGVVGTSWYVVESAVSVTRERPAPRSGAMSPVSRVVIEEAPPSDDSVRGRHAWRQCSSAAPGWMSIRPRWWPASECRGPAAGGLK